MAHDDTWRGFAASVLKEVESVGTWAELARERDSRGLSREEPGLDAFMPTDGDSFRALCGELLLESPEEFFSTMCRLGEGCGCVIAEEGTLRRATEADFRRKKALAVSAVKSRISETEVCP